MNKKILVIPVLLLTFALFSIPVMAAPATKIEGVTLTAVAPPAPDFGFPRFVAHDTIVHSRGTSTGKVTLTIPGYPLPEGDWDSEWITNGNFKQDPAEVVIRGKVTLTFTGEGTTGTFKGVIQRKIIGYPPTGDSIFEDHMVLQGTGNFKGQTLKLSYEGTLPVIDEGYLIIRK